MATEKTTLSTQDKIFILRNKHFKTAEELSKLRNVPLEWITVYVRDTGITIKASKNR